MCVTSKALDHNKAKRLLFAEFIKYSPINKHYQYNKTLRNQFNSVSDYNFSRVKGNDYN